MEQSITSIMNSPKSVFEPDYGDLAALRHIQEQMNEVETVTTPADILRLRQSLSRIALDQSRQFIVIAGRCAEPVSPNDPHEAIREHVETLAMLDEVNTLDAPILPIIRGRGQNTKPRSSQTETLPSGHVVRSWQGDAVNDSDSHNRRPDPQRLLWSAKQAASVEQNLRDKAGGHVAAAHEVLNLDYEAPFVRSTNNGDNYLLSTDLPWIGLRTNQPDSRPVRLLAQVENPIGIKIGDTTTPLLIEQLSNILNPQRQIGKLVWHYRFGPGCKNLTDAIRAVHEFAPHSLHIYDIHGVTRSSPEGAKIRSVEEIKDSIDKLNDRLSEAGTRLHGVHLETIQDRRRVECVDHRHQSPIHPGGVDPQLNPRQTLAILRHSIDMMYRRDQTA